MIGGASWSWWIGFHIAVVALLLVDSFLPGRRNGGQSRALSLSWTGFLVLVAAAFAGWIALRQGRIPAMQFVAGYTIETSLSIDNLFVFLLLFRGFEVSPHKQHTALAWGIGGAVVLRALFIAAGVTLLHRFHWISYVFGAALAYAAFRLLRGGAAREVIPSWFRTLQPARGSLLPVIFAVEMTDLMFAFDSIPAVLAITHDPFIVYTSNIAAILGLRSLYFVLAEMLERVRFLHYGLGVLLLFIAFKMLAASWIDVPITISLAIIGAILAASALASALLPKEKPPVTG